MSDLGTARGRIVIDTSDLRRAQTEVQNASRAMTQTLGALGLGVSARQFGQFVVEANEMATAFARQSVAARELAGSQAQVNDLLRVYDRATGGVLDKAQALSDVTRLLAIGFADSTEELDQFARAARGLSLATGRTQEFVITNLQLELLNQTGRRLDQIGLDMEEVRKRADELAAANENLSSEQAYQAAVLDTASRKFGNLTKSAEAQATGIERLRKAWRDFQLEMGQNSGSALNQFAEGGIRELTALQQMIEGVTEDFERLNQTIGRSPAAGFFRGLSEFLTIDPISPLLDDLNEFFGIGNQPDFKPTQAGRQRQLTPNDTGVQRFNDEQRQVIRDHYDAVADLEAQAARDRQDATQQYEAQRTSTIRQYELTIAREAEDFARSRLRAEQDFQRSVGRMQRDAQRRDERAAEDLARTLGRAVADSDERLAEVREDANERLQELEEDYNRNRERALEDHQDKLLSAAGRLDAIAILEERKRFARQSRDAKEAFDEQRADANEQLAERIADEREALAERRQDAQEAFDRQLEDAREADRQRQEDMQDDFALRQAREDEDRATRLRRMGEDHQLQLEEQARQHELRMLQIIEQETRERAQLEEQFNVALNEAKIRNDAWIAEDKRRTDAAIANYTRATAAAAANAAWLAQIATGQFSGGPALGNPNFNLTRPLPAPAASSTTNRNNSTGPVFITVNAAPGQSAYDVGAEVREQFTLLLEEMGR